MIKNHIYNSILRRISYSLTADQEKLLSLLSGFSLQENERELLLVKGYAGTGKTTMISSFIQALNEMEIRSVLLAPTGRAAKVLSSYAGFPAMTIHKKIYRQQSAKDAFGTFALDKNMHTNTYFIVDEASMLSDHTQEASVFGTGNLLDDLIRYVYNDKRCKLILVGDTAQLPPVGQFMSLSMNKSFLESFNVDVIEHELREVVRQARESGILTNASAVRELIVNENCVQPKFQCAGFKDIVRIAGTELTEAITEAYSRFGKDDTIVICRSNKIANKYNNGIRGGVLARDEELSAGDYMMVVKNNYFWMEDKQKADFIANGDIVMIKRVKKYVDLYGFRFAEADIILPDYDHQELHVKLLLDTIYAETPALTSEQNKSLFYTIAEDFADETSKKKQFAKVKESPYFNALQVKFAYAVTCHKSQGGQWKAVFVDQSFFRDDMLTPEYLKWLYTAITRTTERLYLVNFGDIFFD